MRREVSFIDEEVKRWIEESGPEDGLCLRRFKADVTVCGVSGWKAGDIVQVSGSIYEVTEAGKRCFDECKLLRRTGECCPLAKGAAFGRRVNE